MNKEKNWWISKLNNETIPREVMPKANEIIISDCTLRDGECQSGVVFSVEEKVEIARKLDEVGIHEIEAGMTVKSDEDDIQAVKRIVNDGLNARIRVYCSDLEDLNLALKCGAESVAIGVHFLDGFEKLPEDKIAERFELFQYAKDHGLYTAYSMADIAYADLGLAKRMCSIAVKDYKVDVLRISDTTGCLSPFAIQYIIREIGKAACASLEVHCHDDFGLATANTLASVAAGARYLSTTVNGIGARAGNAATEEVLIGLLMLFQLDLGLRYEELLALSQLVSKMSKVGIHPHKAITGESVFAHESWVTKKKWQNQLLMEPYLAEVVGQKHELVLGKKSGEDSIEIRAEELGIALDKGQARNMLDKVRKYSKSKKSAVSGETFGHLIEEATN